jgi:hypothetical protein
MNNSRKRQTVYVADLRDRVNTMLRAKDGQPEGRVALSVLLESVLMEAGQYRGFTYLDRETDDTRRRYH